MELLRKIAAPRTADPAVIEELNDLSRHVAGVLLKLDSVRRLVISERFRVGACRDDQAEVTLQEVGDMLNLTRQRIEQLQKSGVLKLSFLLRQQADTAPTLPSQAPKGRHTPLKAVEDDGRE